jgi:predicted aspartyl protease
MTRKLPYSGAVVLGLALVLVTWPAPRPHAQAPAAAVQIDADDLGGGVRSKNGPEAGVWVIAETTERGTRFAKMAVTDDRGRYVIPGADNDRDMGLFDVTAQLTGPTGRTRTVELLVDTGATLVVIPRTLADELELTALRLQAVQPAGGRREVWPIAEIHVALDDREVTTPCFIAPGGRPLVGAVALESLFLGVDPVAKRLVQVEGFVGSRRDIVRDRGSRSGRTR